MDTSALCTGTTVKRTSYPSFSIYKPCALDVGYGGTKFLTDNVHGCFMSFARQVDTDDMIMTEHTEDTLLYCGEDNIQWSVGEAALRGINVRDTSESANTLYLRDWSGTIKVQSQNTQKGYRIF